MTRKRAIHTWTTKHPITSAIPNGSMILSILFWAFRRSPVSSTYLRRSWTQVFTETYRPDAISNAFLLFVFRILALRIWRRSMLGECQGAIVPFVFQRMCRSRWNLCFCSFMVRASTFLLNLVWICCAFTKKSTLHVGFFSSAMWSFLQPKRVWKEKGRLGRLCCGDQARSGSNERLWYTDACCDGPDGSVYSIRLIHVVLSDRLLPFVAYP